LWFNTNIILHINIYKDTDTASLICKRHDGISEKAESQSKPTYATLIVSTNSSFYSIIVNTTPSPPIECIVFAFSKRIHGWVESAMQSE